MPGPDRCQEVAPLLPSHADGALTASERGPVEQHLASCASCTREAARLKENGTYLREVFTPFRMPAEFSTDFLFHLPRKDGRRTAASGPSAPRSEVMGDTRPRRAGIGSWFLGIAGLGIAATLGWLFLRPEPPPRQPRQSTENPDKSPRGDGSATARKPPVAEPPVKGPATKPRGPAPIPASGEVLRSAADLVAAARGVRGETYGPMVQRAWDLLARSPAEAEAVRKAAGEEKDPKARAALVLSLGALADEDSRMALRRALADDDPGVRAAAILAIGKSLAVEGQPGQAIHSGPPLNMAVTVGRLPDEGARADILARLGVETSPEVQRTLVMALAPSAPEDPAIRVRMLDGVRGTFGDELRVACVHALENVKDPALVGSLAEVLSDAGTPAQLHGVVLEVMVHADAAAAAEAFGRMLPTVAAPELRRALVMACARTGNAEGQKALLQAATGDADETVRLTAVQHLARFPGPEVREALQKIAENDPDGAVRQEADRILKTLRPAERPEGQGENPPPVEKPPDGN